MNLNYIGSVAERFMKFRSSLSTEEDVSEDIFNAISIYVPKSLASANLVAGAYDPDEITATKYAVVTVTVDNYTDVLSETGSLLTQWLPVFNDGTNSDVTLYLVIFDDTGFAPTVGDASISWSPLSKAFKELYFISFFKTMFSEHYDGSKVEHDPAEEGDYDDSNFFDLSLCLAYQCELESTLSYFLSEVQVTVFEEGEADANACKVMSLERGDETGHCTTLTGSTLADRAEYYWGYLNLIAPTHTEMVIHNGSFMIPILLGKWFEDTNSSGEYVGNSYAKIRLSGTKVKPTGLPSPLDSDVNMNIGSYIYDILDAKNVGYFISISSSSKNNAELIADNSVSAFPLPAYMIARFIDYQTSMDLANYATASSTLTDPVLVNEQTYKAIQNMLVANIKLFSGTNRITNIKLDFPPFAEVKDGNSIKGKGVWSAVYVGSLESVEISGEISF